MTREEHLEFCRICNHHKYDSGKGIICQLTNEIADFDPTCDSFDMDEQLKEQRLAKLVKNEMNQNIASQGKRFTNHILDTIFLIIFNIFFGMTLGVILAVLSPETLDSIEHMGVLQEYLLGFVVAMFYFSLFEIATGRTPAKFITKTKVVDENGNPASFESILIRSLCRFIPFEAFSFLGGEPVIGWHDSFSKTRVVVTK